MTTFVMDFSNASSAGASQGDQKRKRNRKVLSCQPCHRQKVKCDRNLPCRRCIQGNRESQCTYQSGFSESSDHHDMKAGESLEAPTSPSIASQEVGKSLLFPSYQKGRARFKGWTHWAPILNQFQEAAPYVRGHPRQWREILHQLQDLKTFYPRKIPRAFPFGDSIGNLSLINSDLLTFLPSKEITRILVEHYLNTFDIIFPLLDNEVIQKELVNFWDKPRDFSNAWLAQLFLILALSINADPFLPSESILSSTAEFSKRCIDGAEVALLTEGNYMSKPNLTIMRVLAMIAIAKQLEIVTLNDSNGKCVYISFVVRVGMTQCIHMSPSLFPDMPKSQIEAHQRVWTTMIILAITDALEVGSTLLIQPDQFEASSFSSHSSFRSNNQSINETFAYQQLLAKIFPVVVSTINRVNSTHPRMDPEESREFHLSLKQLLQMVDISFSKLSYNRSQKYSNLSLQKTFLEVILHKSLIALQFGYILDPESCQDPMLARRTIQQSSQTVLQIYRRLHLDTLTKWLAKLFIGVFCQTAIHVAVIVRKDDYDETDSDSSTESPKSQAWSSLHGVFEIYKQNLTQSLHLFKMYRGFTALIKALEAKENGTSIEDALYAAGREIVESVLLSHGKSLETEFAQDNGTQYWLQYGSNLQLWDGSEVIDWDMNMDDLFGGFFTS